MLDTPWNDGYNFMGLTERSRRSWRGRTPTARVSCLRLIFVRAAEMTSTRVKRDFVCSARHLTASFTTKLGKTDAELEGVFAPEDAARLMQFKSRVIRTGKSDASGIRGADA